MENNMKNPASKAVKKLGGPTVVGTILGVSRQAVNGWNEESGAPVYLIRALSLASGVPIDEFLSFEEAKKGVNAGALSKALKEAAEDRQ